uniref:Putative plasma membrane glycoprotein cd36 n=1 Tax=Corethrella appendiculata TaxID=1370023 RepID=U5ERK4_9DIPT
MTEFKVTPVSESPSQNTNQTNVNHNEPSANNSFSNHQNQTVNNSDNKKITVLDNIFKYLENNFNCKAMEFSKIILIGVLVLIFFASIMGFFIMWFTDAYNNSLLEKLILANDTNAKSWWIKPPIQPLLKVHIFNYTNADRFLKGLDTKLRVEDLGPYVYKETPEKINLKYHNDSTITYQDNKIYDFDPELSNGKQYDKVVVPNVPMISAIAMFQYSGFVKQFALKAALSATSSTPFKTLAAHSFLWGYEDKLIELSGGTGYAGSNSGKFGILMNKNGTSRDIYTIHSGENGLNKLSTIKDFNGVTKLDFWGTDECNKVEGTVGAQFPPHLMDKKQPLNLYITDLCRKFPLAYNKEVTVFEGIPAWRYKPEKNVFAHPNIHADNQCYCHLESGVCPPSGLFNASLCSHNAPVLISFPHFYEGDESLQDTIDGLSPNQQLHETYADIHPRLAFAMNGASRFQINIQVKKNDFAIDGFEKFKDDQILPVLWMEVTTGEIPVELKAMVYHSTFTANAIQMSLRYGSLCFFLLTLALLIGTCYCKRKINRKDNEAAVVNDNYGASGTDNHASEISVKLNVDSETIQTNGV